MSAWCPRPRQENPPEASGQLSAVVIAWKDDNESQAKSDKMKSVQRDLHAAGRWTGGRVPFGKRAICLCHGLEICPDLKNCQGWELDTHEANARLLRDVAPKVIAGKSVNAVTADLNSAEIPSADGKAWSSHTLRKILRNPASAYVIGAGAWSDVQAALGHSPTSGNRGTRTATDNASAGHHLVRGLRRRKAGERQAVPLAPRPHRHLSRPVPQRAKARRPSRAVRLPDGPL